jgi:ABC-type nickel/cobalt efflux system permease component RcnA
VSDATTFALLSTAAATALLHTLIPDHWLPFVLIGRTRGWSISTVALASGLAAVIHVGLSVLLGVVALWIGIRAVDAVGHTLEGAGAILLMAFGLGYALWGWTKGGHFHPGGALLHRGDTEGACRGDEGPAHPEHLHYHADGGLIGDRVGRWGAVSLAVIVGINPCVLVLPVMLASVPRGPGTVALVAAAYALPATALMVGLSVIGVLARWPVRLPGAARYAEMASGLVIALLGLAFWLLER